MDLHARVYLFLIGLVPLAAVAQITVDPLPPMTSCGALTTNVAFTAVGTYNVGNEFTVQLSDAAGSFAAPTVIGSVPGTGSGTVVCAFPEGIVGSSGQAIRVVASDPAEVGEVYVLPITTAVPSNAGESAVISFCSDHAPMDLLSLLGGSPQPGGTWTGPGGTNGVFDPGIDQPGVYEYHVPGEAPCPNATSTLVITVSPAPNAGEDSSVAVCLTSPPFPLFTFLGGTPQPGGMWTGPGGGFSGLFNPAVHAPGCYTYTVLGTAPCSNSTAVVCVSVEAPPDLGQNSSISVCANAAPVDLGAALPDGGTWDGPDGPHSGMFDPAVDPPGLYTYSIVDGTCPGGSVVVTISVIPVPNAGTDSTITVCTTATPFIMINMLGGDPGPGGAWTSPEGTQMSGVYMPGTDPPGCYTYVHFSDPLCEAVIATLCILEEEPPSAGSNAAINWCQSWGVADLFEQLGGTPTPGGTWVDVNSTGGLNGGHFNPVGIPEGTYAFTYTTAAVACPQAQATVTVTLSTVCVVVPENPYPVE